MIIITGANGKLGRATVDQLLSRTSAENIGVSVRDPEQARDLAALGVRVRRGEFDDAASLAHAFEGASKVLIVSSNTGGDRTVQQHQTAIDAAGAAGAGRLYYTSHAGADLISAFPPARSHAATELALRDSGVPFTALRNGFYVDTAVMLVQTALRTGELRAPRDGPMNYTAHPDLAAATAAALLDDDLDDTILTLTGPAAIDAAELAALASDLAGREVKRVVVSDDEFRAGLVAQGLPEPRAAMMLGMFVAARQGGFSRVDPTLARLIGRPAASVQDVLGAVVASA